MTFDELILMSGKVPAPIWTLIGVAITGIVTCATIAINNISNNNRQKKQLIHDSIEKEKERTTKARHEIYLKAAEEIARAQRIIAARASAPTDSYISANELQDFFATSIKFQLVAEPRSAQLMQELAFEYEGTTVRLSKKFIPLQNLRAEIESTESLYDRSNGDLERLLLEERTILESGESKSPRLAPIRTAIQVYAESTEKYGLELQALADAHREKHNAFVLAVIEELIPLTNKQSELIQEIRKDLGQKELQANKEMHYHNERMKAELTDLLKSLKEESQNRLNAEEQNQKR